MGSASRPSRVLAGVMALACVLGAIGVPVASADDDREGARRAYATAESLFRSGDYRGALTYFRTADVMHPTPVTVYNIGLCHERLGELEQAVTQYRAYLAAVPGAPNKAQVEARIAQLEQDRAGTNAIRTPELYDEVASGPAEQAPAEDPFWQRIPSRPAGPRPPTAMPEGPYARDAVLRPVPGPAAASPAMATGPAPTSAAGPQPDRDRDRQKPLYKEWWFWAIVGVSAIVLYDVATTDADPPSRNQPSATLLSF